MARIDDFSIEFLKTFRLKDSCSKLVPQLYENNRDGLKILNKISENTLDSMKRGNLSFIEAQTHLKKAYSHAKKDLLDIQGAYAGKLNERKKYREENKKKFGQKNSRLQERFISPKRWP